MQNVATMRIIKIIVIVAIVLTVIAQILPWRGMHMSYDAGALLGTSGTFSIGYDFYTWGGHFNLNIPSSIPTTIGSFDVWSLFYVINIGLPETLTSSLSTPLEYSAAAGIGATAAFFVCFAFSIITIIAGLVALSRKRACLIAGITSLISIIAFIAGFTITFSIDPTGTAAQMIGYSAGFFIIIVAMIMFFVAFGFHVLLPYANASEIRSRDYPDYQLPRSMETYNFPASTTSAKKKCPNCGATLNGNPDYCSNCSTKLR